MQCVIPSLLEYLHLTPTVFYIIIVKNLGMRLALYICVDQPEIEDEFTLQYTFTHIHSYLITRYKNTHGISEAAR